MKRNKVVVIGGGAAGMMAAISAADNGADVTLIERNEKLGKKIYITGKGRCNVTNNCDEDEFFNNIVSNPRFMYVDMFLDPSSAAASYILLAVVSFFSSNDTRPLAE